MLDQSHKLAMCSPNSANVDLDTKAEHVNTARKASTVIPIRNACLAIVILTDQDQPIAILRLVNANMKVKFLQQFLKIGKWQKS